MNKPLIAVLIVIGVVVLSFAIAIYSITDTNRVIAENVTVSSNWLEIRPSPPLVVSKQSQYISLDVEGVRRDNPYTYTDPKDAFKIELLDGTFVTPEIQVVDEYGNVFKLDDWMEDYTGKGFTPESKFPRDRVYSLIRIRTDKPIHCKRIIWHCHTGK